MESERTKTSLRSDACRILLVDDQELVVRSIARVLQRCGHDVRCVLDGPSALEEARSFGPDLALVDISLPGMDGFELAAQLRAEPAFESLMLVALSGYDAHEIEQQVRDAGFDHHLVKPPCLETLNALIATAANGVSPKPR